VNQQTLLAAVLWANTLFVIHLLTYTWSRRQAPAAKAVTFALLAFAIYSGGYAAQIMSVEPTVIRFWIKVQYVGIVALPPLWLLICMRYTNTSFYSKYRRLEAFLWSISAVFLFLVFIEHPLHYADFRLVRYGELTLPVTEPGIAYVLYSIYANLFLIIGGVVLSRGLKKAAQPVRKPGWLMLIGAAALWLSYIANIIGLTPPGLDITPFFLSISAVIWTVAIFNQRLLDLKTMGLEMLFESIQLGVILLDKENRIIEHNPAAVLILPELNAGCKGEDLSVVIAHYPDLSSFITDMHADKLALSLSRADGNNHYRCTKYPLHRKGKQLGICLVLYDDTSEELLRQKMEMEASRDYLTGAYTRRFLSEKGASYLAAAKQNNEPFSLIMIDLDHYKAINDSQGHLTGDMILQHTVDLLQSHLPQDALLVRYGGDEFVVLLPKTDLTEACHIAEQLCSVVRRHALDVHFTSLNLTLSCGVAQLQSPNDTLATLLGQADQAVYLAKQEGGDCVRWVQ
jgi:diguanylate cyclase (GGDEF)-like protein